MRGGPMMEKTTGRKHSPMAMEKRMVPKINAKNVRKIYVQCVPWVSDHRLHINRSGFYEQFPICVRCCSSCRTAVARDNHKHRRLSDP